MIELFLYPPFGETPSTSPFCIKVDCFLRMAGLPYVRRYQTIPRGAPKGKLPYIVDGQLKVADSAFIVEVLQLRHGLNLDHSLDAVTLAQAHAVRRMTEDSLYWALVHSRWLEERNWPTVKKSYFGSLPPVIRTVVAALGRHRMRGQLWGHGMGRHASDEIYALGKADIATLAELLGRKSFMMGEEPTLVDATVYAFLTGLAFVPVSSPLSDEVRAHTNLIDYADRMRGRYYG
jgi:glutathione S-transferase